MWSAAQQRRLALEKQILEKNFQNIRWRNPTRKGATQVEIDFSTNVGGRYTLRLYVPDDWPNSCPDLTIAFSSKPIKKRNGDAMPTRNGQFHTLNYLDGCLCICHFKPATWDANNTMYLVFLKGRLWLEAFENHLKSGYAIDHYLKHM